MAANPLKMMQMMSLWKTFQQNHPKFPAFLAAARGEVREGSVIEIAIVTPEGKRLESNLKLTASDMELMDQLKEQA